MFVRVCGVKWPNPCSYSSQSCRNKVGIVKLESHSKRNFELRVSNKKKKHFKIKHYKNNMLLSFFYGKVSSEKQWNWRAKRKYVYLEQGLNMSRDMDVKMPQRTRSGWKAFTMIKRCAQGKMEQNPNVWIFSDYDCYAQGKLDKNNEGRTATSYNTEGYEKI